MPPLNLLIRACRRRAVVTVAMVSSVSLVLLLGFFVTGAFEMAEAMGMKPGEEKQRVAFVYDGDTVRTSTGLIVRYIGIDTPERGEPLYEAARERNAELVMGKEVELWVCTGEPRDKYGRTLGWVYVDGLLVNGVLLEEGFGRTLLIPPCGNEKREELLDLEKNAKEAGVGIWAE